MTDKLIRDIPDEVLQAIQVKAAEDGMSTEAWLRAQLVRLAAQPILKKRYKFTAFGPGESYATIHRHGADGPVQQGAKNCSQEQFEAFKKAALYCERNEVGDYEAAYKLLLEHFDDVFVS